MNENLRTNSRILNDDILLQILKHLNVKELLATQRVSLQFQSIVKYLAQHQKGLSFNVWNDKDIQCSEGDHSFIGGNASSVLITRDVNSVINRKALKSVLQKFANIKCLFINVSFDYNSFKIIVQNCKSIECLKLCPEFLNSELRIKRMTSLLSKLKITSLSITNTHFNVNQINALILKCFPLLQNLTFHVWQELGTTLRSVKSKDIQSLVLSNFCHQNNNTIELNEIKTLINRNERKIEVLKIMWYSVNQTFINDIQHKTDLRSIFLNCSDLSFDSILLILESNKHLMDICLIDCNFQKQQNVRKFGQIVSKAKKVMISGKFNKDVFIQFIQCFQCIETFGFNLRINCGLYDSDCETCYTTFYKSLTNFISIEKLIICSSHCVSQLINSLPLYQNLVFIKERFNGYDNEVMDFMKLLIQKFIPIANKNPEKTFKIESQTTIKDVLLLDIPKNLKLIDSYYSTDNFDSCLLNH